MGAARRCVDVPWCLCCAEPPPALAPTPAVPSAPPRLCDVGACAIQSIAVTAAPCQSTVYHITREGRTEECTLESWDD